MRKYKTLFGQYWKPGPWLPKVFVNFFLRHVFLTFIVVIITWPIIISVNNVEIILLPSKQKYLTAYCLPLFFSGIILVFVGNNIIIN